ncbi:MAG: nicotinate-nucleotide adenylyltransferase [Dehalococcoidia bacterium]
MARPIALLGGTFDPPHIGHLVLGECVGRQFDCERVIYMPAGNPYRKSGVRDVTPGAMRLEMTRLAIAGNPRFALDDREVRRSGPTYTVETLRELRDEGHDEILLVLGSDAVAQLPEWRESDEIRRLARIVVAEKNPGADTGGYPRVDMPLLPISSTIVRERVRAGLPIRYLVVDAVNEYIVANKLYRDSE